MIDLFYFLFLGTLGWGISLSLIKVLLVSLTPTEIVLYRMAIGSILLIGLTRYLRIQIQNITRLCIDGLIVGLFNMAIPYYFTSVAETSLSSSLTAIMNGLTPVLTFLIGIVFFTRQTSFHWINILCLCLGVVGVICMHADIPIHSHEMTGLMALFITSLSYGIAANYVKCFSRTQNPLLLSATAALMTTLLMLVTKLLNDPTHWHYPVSLSSFAALAWLGCMGTGCCLYLYCYLIQKKGALLASMVTYLMTLTSVMTGIFVLHETLRGTALIGSILMIASLLLMNNTLFLVINRAVDRSKKILIRMYQVVYSAPSL